MDATTVIIPCRNEERTIGAVVGAFTMHPEHDFHVYVAIDGHTTDDSAQRVLDWQGIPLPFPDLHGKGEVVSAMVYSLEAAHMISPRVVLCDGDYTGLTFDHVSKLMESNIGMTVGVPDWPDCDIPDEVTMAWPRVSGLRYLPYPMIPRNSHGYLLETQINLKVVRARMPIRTALMPGLKSPFQWPMTPRRAAALELDRQWGKEHGVL